MPLILVVAALSGLAVAVAEPSAAGAPPQDPLDAYYPPAARAAGLEGYVVLSCDNHADGRLSDCKVVEETPKGAGFGQASLQAARLFRYDLRTEEGASIEGARVRIAVRWRLDHTAPPPGTTVQPGPH